VLSGNLDVTGNINVTGNLNYSNVTDLVIGDPLIYVGANNTGDTVDLGIVASYNNGTYYHTGIARNASTDYWTFFDGVVAEPTTVIDWANATYPTVKLGNLLATGTVSATGNGTFGNVTGGNLVTANYISGTLTTAAQPNITSIGTLSSLSVTGNVTANSITTSGGGSGGNISGANVITATTLYAYGNVTASNANLGNLATANYFSGDGSLLTGVVVSTAGTVTTNAQPNITSTGTLTTLTVSGESNLGAVGNVTITGGSNTQVLSTDGAGNLSWVDQGGSGGGITTGKSIAMAMIFGF